MIHTQAPIVTGEARLADASEEEVCGQEDGNRLERTGHSRRSTPPIFTRAFALFRSDSFLVCRYAVLPVSYYIRVCALAPALRVGKYRTHCALRDLGSPGAPSRQHESTIRSPIRDGLSFATLLSPVVGTIRRWAGVGGMVPHSPATSRRVPLVSLSRFSGNLTPHYAQLWDPFWWYVHVDLSLSMYQAYPRDGLVAFRIVHNCRYASCGKRALRSRLLRASYVGQRLRFCGRGEGECKIGSGPVVGSPTIPNVVCDTHCDKTSRRVFLRLN